MKFTEREGILYLKLSLFAISQLVAVVFLSYKKIVILFSITIHICQVGVLKNINKLNILVRYHGSGYMFANFIVHMLPAAKPSDYTVFSVTLHCMPLNLVFQTSFVTKILINA